MSKTTTVPVSMTLTLPADPQANPIATWTPDPVAPTKVSSGSTPTAVQYTLTTSRNGCSSYYFKSVSMFKKGLTPSPLVTIEDNQASSQKAYTAPCTTWGIESIKFHKNSVTITVNNSIPSSGTAVTLGLSLTAYDHKNSKALLQTSDDPQIILEPQGVGA